MNPMTDSRRNSSQFDQRRKRSLKGFSLIEVILALGIFLITVLAMVGLLGPTLSSVDEIEKTDEIVSVVNTVNAFLQGSPDIATAGSKFDAIYEAVRSDGYATVFVFRRFSDSSGTDVELKVGFQDETGDFLIPSDFADIAGPIYRVVFTASSVTPDAHLNETDTDGDGIVDRNGDGIYTLEKGLDDYPEGYLAIEVRVFALDRDIAKARSVPGGAIPDDIEPSDLNLLKPLFTYNTAITR